VTDKIKVLPVLTSLDIPAKRVIDGLVEDKEDFTKILVLGFDNNNKLVSRSNTSNVGTLLELMEHFKHNLMSGEYDSA